MIGPYTQPLLLTIIAGSATALGSLIYLFLRDFKQSRLCFLLGVSAGSMLYISFVELLSNSIAEIGFLKSNVCFFLGIAAMMILNSLIPHQYLAERSDGIGDKGKSLYHAGVLIALGVAIHNLPEGLAVFISAATDIKLGSALAFAIAIHNIPEGIAVAVPIYYATKSRSKAFWFSVFSGLAEPLGALIGLYFFLDQITPSIIAYLFSTVAGIMVFVSFDELLPQMFQSEKHHHAISGLFLGMFIVMVSLAI